MLRIRPGLRNPLLGSMLLASLGLACSVLMRPADMAAQGVAPTVLWRGNPEDGTTADWWAPEAVGVEGNNCGGEYTNGDATSRVTSVQKHSGSYALVLRV